MRLRWRLSFLGVGLVFVLGSIIHNNGSRRHVHDPRLVKAQIDAQGLANTPETRHSVPAILHQTWKTNVIPGELRRYVASWKRFNPSWEYRFWNDSTALTLVQRDYGWFMPTFLKFRSGVERSDILRYILLHRFGGVYADLDMECLRSFTPLLARGQVFLGAEPHEHARRQGRRNLLLCNALMGSPPGDSFWLAVLRSLEQEVSGLLSWAELTPVDTTGPVFLTRLFEEHPEVFADVRIYPSSAFYPLVDTKRTKWAKNGLLNVSELSTLTEQRGSRTSAALFENAWAVHRWRHLWLPGRNGGNSPADYGFNGKQTKASATGTSTASTVAAQGVLSDRDIANLLVEEKTNGYRTQTSRVQAQAKLGVAGVRVFCQLMTNGSAGHLLLRGSSSGAGLTFGSSYVGAVGMNGETGGDGMVADELLFNVVRATRGNFPANSLDSLLTAGSSGVLSAIVILPRTANSDSNESSIVATGVVHTQQGQKQVNAKIDIADIHEADPSSTSREDWLVFLSPQSERGLRQSSSDTFVAQLQHIDLSSTGANNQLDISVTVARLDVLGGVSWHQQLDMQYLVLHPGPSGRCTAAPTSRMLGFDATHKPRERRRETIREAVIRGCGVVNVGTPPHGSSAVRAIVHWNAGVRSSGLCAFGEGRCFNHTSPGPVFSRPGSLVRVLLQPRNQDWASDIRDIMSAVITGVDQHGFNATIRRVDRLGEGWGAPLELQWLAWEVL